MEIKVDDLKLCSLIKLIGRVVYETESDLKDLIEKMIAENKIKLILDFEKLTYINSSGLGLLINLLKQIRNLDGGDIVLINLNEDIYELFKITSLVQVFTIKEDLDTAISHFEK